MKNWIGCWNVKACMLLAMALLPALGITSSTVSAQDTPVAAPATQEHALLKRFAGKWTSKSKGTAGPGQPEMECSGQMSSRMLGDFWVVNDLRGDMMGTPMTGLQTIGYDAEKKKYVGTWVDSMMNHMWRYEGSVDPSGNILTLEAEGPSFTGDGTKAQYRDAYEFKSDDEIIATSSMQGPDGQWIVFMTGVMTRVK